MSEERVIGQFDVTLSEDLVKDFQTAGRVVKTEIWEQGEGKRGLVGCIFVDKNEQDVIRLRVTVFNQPGEGSEDSGAAEKATPEAAPAPPKAEQVSTESQTEHSGDIPVPAELVDHSMQAAQTTDEKPQQTELQLMAEHCSQTTILGYEQKQIQTDVKPLAGKTTQTKINTYDDLGVQTTIKELSERFMQTDIKTFKSGVVQTDIKKFSNCALQTEPKPSREFSFQTDQWIGTHQCLQVCPDLVESAFQTDPKPTRVSVVQTFIDTDEKLMQTENPVAEKEIQTQVLTCDKSFQAEPPVQSTLAQTDNPVLVSTDMQTTRDYLVDLDCQTDEVIVIDPEEMCENDSQTDFVRVIDPRNETSTECQTEPCKVIYPDQYMDSDLQTDSVKIINPEEMVELEVQTDEVHIRNPECQAEVELQTDDVSFKEPIETVNTEAQTNLVWIFGLSQAPEPEGPEGEVTKQTTKEADTSTTNVDIPEGEDVPPSQAPVVEKPEAKVNMESNIIQGGPVSAVDFVAPEGTDISQDQDTQKGIQTDPVTIIIGDSSFLVNKLKVYAQREMRFMEGTRGRGPRTRGRGRGGRGRGTHTSGPPSLMQAGNLPSGEVGEMPTLNAESTPRGASAVRKTPMSAPPATRRPFTGLKHRTSPQDIREICKTPEKKGRFNCPFCTTVFNDSASLYKHLREEHGSPRASNRRRRRKGTILIAEDGSLITDDGTIEIPPLKKDVPLGPIRANNIQKSQSTILHEQHMAKMRAMANTQSLKKSEEEAAVGRQHENAVSNGTSGATSESIQISETPLMGQRAFSCPFCPKLFTKSSALYIHLQNAHKAVKQKPTKTKSHPSDQQEEELVEVYEDNPDLVHEEEVELVVPGDAAHLKSEGELEEEEGEILLEVAHQSKTEDGEVELEEEAVEEGEVILEETYEEGEVQLEQEVVTEEVVEEQVMEEMHEGGEVQLEGEGEVIGEEGEIVLEEEVVSEEPEGGEVLPIEEELEEGEVIKHEPEVEEEDEEEDDQEEEEVVVEGEAEAEAKSLRPRGKVRTRGGLARGRGGALVERGIKRRRSEQRDDDEEMPQLTRVTRRSVQLESPIRSTRRGPKILSPAKRGRR